MSRYLGLQNGKIFSTGSNNVCVKGMKALGDSEMLLKGLKMLKQRSYQSSLPRDPQIALPSVNCRAGLVTLHSFSLQRNSIPEQTKVSIVTFWMNYSTKDSRGSYSYHRISIEIFLERKHQTQKSHSTYFIVYNKSENRFDRNGESNDILSNSIYHSQCNQ